MSTIYLSMADATYIHQKLINEFGGALGVRDAGLVEAALLRPQTGYYSDLLEEAAALWESLAMNHGFVDGYKRVAFAVMEIFLDINGFQITASQTDAEEFIYSNLEAGTFTKDSLDAWLRGNTKEA